MKKALLLLLALALPAMAAPTLTTLTSGQVIGSGTNLAKATAGGGGGGGGWTPSTPSNTLKQWNRPEDLPSPASTWPAVAGVTLTELGSGSSPVRVDGAHLGQPIVRFDGANKYLQGVFSGNQNYPYTVGIICKLNETDFNRTVLGGNAVEDTVLRSVGGNYQFYSDNGGVQTVLAADTSWHCFLFVVNGSSSTYQVDGGTENTSASGIGTAAMHAVTLSNNNGGTTPANVDISEVAVWDGVLGSGDKAAWFTRGVTSR